MKNIISRKKRSRVCLSRTPIYEIWSDFYFAPKSDCGLILRTPIYEICPIFNSNFQFQFSIPIFNPPIFNPPIFNSNFQSSKFSTSIFSNDHLNTTISKRPSQYYHLNTTISKRPSQYYHPNGSKFNLQSQFQFQSSNFSTQLSFT
jgi:hypothetical protein